MTTSLNQHAAFPFIYFLNILMNKLLSALLLLFTFVISANAASEVPLDLQYRFNHYYASYTVNADGTAVEAHEWSKTILKETTLESAKSISISYSTSAEKAEVVDAYTVKADGRRIDVPKDNFQIEVNSGKGGNTPVYSDRTSLTIVYPDVAVGDKVVISYKLTQTEPMFPNHFSVTNYFYDQIAYDDIRIRFDYPESMWAQHEARGMEETIDETNNGRKVVEWQYKNPTPIKSERQDFSVFDTEKIAGFSFSTFRNYADIATAYGQRAQAKAAVTERISKLAAEIVKDISGQKKQAQALYEWVATNITYAGNCIGIGAVVPRDLDFVLDNKIGDCKDHATLLQALLSARGIDSTQALVNSGSTYKLARIPVVSSVNHVINYLPAFDLYLDSTSRDTPFGMLPFGDQDKPVLHVSNFKEGHKTPIPPVGSNKQVIKTKIKIADDGSITGNIDFSLTGTSAIQTRAWARNMSKEVEEDLVKNMYRQRGMIASGKVSMEDPQALAPNYHFKADLNVDKFIKYPGAGAFHIYPPLGLAAPIYSFLQSGMYPEKEADVTCSHIQATEEYSIELPKKMRVLSIPDNIKVSNKFITFRATYKLKGNMLTVKRIYDDRTKGNVCSPQLFAEFNKLAEQGIDNLKEQVLYK